MSSWRQVYMAISLFPVTPSFAAEVGDIDLSQALDEETLYARSVAPFGGHTEFADLRAAYDALPAKTKARLQGLVAQHSLIFSRRRLGFTEFTPAEQTAFAPVRRPLVRRIPESGRESLYIASHIGCIEGMPDAETETLLGELIAHATQRQFVYTHRWRVGDLVMWDNRSTMHRGTEYED